MNNITLKTDHPIAFDSPDHITPWGTMRDNTTNADFIEEIQEFFELNYGENHYNFLDLGCSGGQLVVDIHNKGNFSVGLEGSDYSVKHQRANWPEYYNKILFTCDVTKPYTVYNNEEKILFNLITAWEVVEHIHPLDLRNFFKYVSNNLKIGGLFLASISVVPDNATGIDLHQSVFTEAEWYKKLPDLLEGLNLKLYKYPFTHKVRWDATSFHILLIKEL
jgi:cyclopropane fatty-acyl-phospholipid synthase-like methyltransferase